MRIDKLYTMSQFVDLINNHDEFDGSKLSVAENRLLAIYEYNDFLKTPLSKEMLVNEVEVKLASENTDEYIKQWQEAEKKVIFEGWSQSVYQKYEIISGTDIIDFSNFDYPKLSRRNSIVKSVQILHDLAEATNGELKLKNVEL